MKFSKKSLQSLVLLYFIMGIMTSAAVTDGLGENETPTILIVGNIICIFFLALFYFVSKKESPEGTFLERFGLIISGLIAYTFAFTALFFV